MIISASRRTDIPALYPEWFMNRIREEEVLVPNPCNRRQVSRISLAPEVVDCIVFWTKNPEPMLPYLKTLDKLEYQYYFQMTVTDYGLDMEPNTPSMEESMATFVLLSQKIGKERLDWRFDPIILNKQYTLSYHLEKFELMCAWMHSHTTRCIISFVDAYKNRRCPQMEEEDMMETAKALAQIAAKYKLPLYTCGEKIGLEEYGIQHASCVDRKKIERLIGYRLDVKKDRRQRKYCGCCKSVDVGMYDTCTNGCGYCYATASQESASKKHELHNPKSEILIGGLYGDETIIDKRAVSDRDIQLSIFDFI